MLNRLVFTFHETRSIFEQAVDQDNALSIESYDEIQSHFQVRVDNFLGYHQYMSPQMVYLQTSRISPFSTPYEGYYLKKVNSRAPFYSFYSSPIEYTLNSVDGEEYKPYERKMYFSSSYSVSIYMTYH